MRSEQQQEKPVLSGGMHDNPHIGVEAGHSWGWLADWSSADPGWMLSEAMQMPETLQPH